MRCCRLAWKSSARLLFPLFLCGLLPGLRAHGQCGPVITSFPYTEGFEAGPAWTSGGTASDWAWGTPAHPFINSAGGGSMSWCVGGLTGTFYNNNERSWLESPCFDFSALSNPRIAFKIFWEVERQYDGMTFQYSTDGGATYSNVGAFGDEPDCNTENWFNSNNLTNLPATITPKHGWSGRAGATQGSCMGGGGSMGWVTARHCLAFLAHAPSVRFRFFFGAGSLCNNFDGIAIDDIVIDESPPVVASFIGDCDGSTVSFINASTPCPHTFSWNFGDPGSATNTSTQEHPAHTYTAPGVYTVTLTATDACGVSGTSTQEIAVLGVSITTTEPSCGQDNGAVQAVVTGANGPVNYYWAPGGATTETLANVGPGTYTVTVSAAGSCSATATATLSPSVGNLALAVDHTDVSCAGANDGTATALVTGGVAPISLSWSPSGETGSTLAGLGPGVYTCTATDAQGCSAEQAVTIAEPAPLILTASPDTAVCAGNSLTLAAEALGGTPGYSYAWYPDGPFVSPTADTEYTVVATDAAGCLSAPVAVQVSVASSFQPSFSVSDSAGCAPLCATFTPQPAGAASYHWDLGDGASSGQGAPTHCYTEAGSYAVTLTVTDAAGCTGSFTRADAVRVHPLPTARFSTLPAVATTAGPTFHFINGSTPGSAFSWHFGDLLNSVSTETSPSFTYAAADCYTVSLVAVNAQGCRDSTRAAVCVEEPFAVYVPNAFTPNGDAMNDVFLPLTTVRDPAHFELIIYDRWGTPLHATQDPHQGWDGGDAPQGVYVWKMWITDSEGNGHQRVGHVLLLE